MLSAIGIGMLTNQAGYRQMAGQFLTGYPFIYFSGIFALVGGLAILANGGLHRRRHRVARTRLLHHVQRLCGVSAAAIASETR